MKAKFRVSQLAAKPIDIELVHPVMGETGIFIKLAGPHSPQFQAARKAYQASEGKEEDGVRLFSSCVIGWDTEAMESEWSVENAFNYFNQPENSWAVEFLTPVIKDEMRFYEKK